MNDFDFPPKVAKKLKEKYPKASKSDIEKAFCGAISYFILCKKYRNNNIPMPSVVVDEVWHEFILHTRDYEYFCQKYLGFFLHHVPNDDESNIDENIAKEQMLSLWIIACQEEGFDPSNPEAKPSLFYADVIFKERPESYLQGFAKDVKNLVVNKKVNKKEKSSVIQNIKKSFGLVAVTKASDAVASNSGNFDLSNLLLTVNVIDDTPSYRSYAADHSGSHVSSKSHGDHSDSSSNHHSCSSSTSHSSCGSSCGSGCGGGGD